MDLTIALNEFKANVLAAYSDKWITVAEAVDICTKAANVLTAAANVLKIDNAAKKALVMEAMRKVYAFVLPRLPLAVQAVLRLPFAGMLVNTLLDGLVEAIYQQFVKGA